MKDSVFCVVVSYTAVFTRYIWINQEGKLLISSCNQHFSTLPGQLCIHTRTRVIVIVFVFIISIVVVFMCYICGVRLFVFSLVFANMIKMLIATKSSLECRGQVERLCSGRMNRIWEGLRCTCNYFSNENENWGNCIRKMDSTAECSSSCGLK